MQRTRAAKSDDAEIARIEAALNRDDAQRAQHDFVGDIDDALGGLFGRKADRLTDLGDRGFGAGDIERHVAAEKNGRQIAENDVGVADGRLGAALAVSDRPGLGAGAARANPQRFRQVRNLGDRAAARADAAHVERRHLGREISDLGRTRDRRLAVNDHRNVGRRPAHVEGEQLLEAGSPRDHDGRRDAAGRT